MPKYHGTHALRVFLIQSGQNNFYCRRSREKGITWQSTRLVSERSRIHLPLPVDFFKNEVEIWYGDSSQMGV